MRGGEGVRGGGREEGVRGGGREEGSGIHTNLTFGCTWSVC